MDGVQVSNLNTEWRDGKVLCALVNHCFPGSIPNIQPDDAYFNLKAAIGAARTHGISPIVQADSFIRENPDETSIILSLSQFVPCGEKSLLEWVKYQIKDIRPVPDHNGQFIGALVHVLSRGKFELYAKMKSEDNLVNLGKSMVAAEHLLDIKQTIMPADVENRKLHNVFRLSYMSQFYRVKMMQNVSEASSGKLHGRKNIKTHARKRFITPSLKGSNFEVVGRDDSYNLRIDLQEGQEELTASCCGSKGTDIPVAVTKTNPESKSYNLKIAPTDSDSYCIRVKADGEEIENSPFMAELKHFRQNNAQKETLKSHELIVENPSVEQLTARCIGENGNEIPVEISETSPGSNVYRLKIETTEPDIYRISVKSGDQEITSSPHVVDMTQEGTPAPKPAIIENITLSSRMSATDTTGEGRPKIAPSDVEVDVITSTINSNIHSDTRIPLGKSFTAMIKDSRYNLKDVVAEAHGKESGRVQVDLRGNEDGSYQLNFSPLKTDHYHIAIKHSGNEIRAFNIDCYDSQTASDESYELEVENPGENKLTASCHGEKGTEIPVEVSETIPGSKKYRLTIKPTELDVYRIVAKSGEQEIKGSPFIVELKPSDAREFVVYRLGNDFEGFIKPDCYEVHMKSQALGKLAATCCGKGGRAIPVDITEVSEGSNRYKFVINPTEPDIYCITIKSDGVEFKDSPLLVELKPSQGKQFVAYPNHGPRLKITAPSSNNLGSAFDASHINDEKRRNLSEDSSYSTPEKHSRSASGDVTGEEQTSFSRKKEIKLGFGKRFSVKVKDSRYKIEDVTAEAHGKETGSEKVELKANEDGSYQLDFNPPKPDHYHIAMKYDGKEIKSFNIHSYYESLVEASDESYELEVENPGEGEFTATCHGEKGKEIPVEISETSPGSKKYRLRIKPSELDMYHILIKSGEREINDSPFTVELKHSAINEFVAYRLGNDLEGFSKSDSYEMHMKSQAQGKLAASCLGEKGQEIPVDISETSPGSKKYKFVIKPTKPDMYRITVKSDGKDVKDSPFYVMLKTSKKKQFVPHSAPLINTTSQSSRGLAGNLTASGPTRKVSGTHSVSGKEVRIPLGKRFTVKVKDSHYKMKDVVAEAHGEESGPAMVEMKENADSSYQLNFKPPKPDHYRIAMLCDGKEIRSFRIHCYESPGVTSSFHADAHAPREGSSENQQEKEKSLKWIRIPFERRFAVNVKQSRYKMKDIVTEAHGRKYGPSDVGLKENEDGSYKLNFVPPMPDHYHIAMKHNGVEFRAFNLECYDSRSTQLEANYASSSENQECYEVLFESQEQDLSAYCYGEKGARVPVDIARITPGSNKYRFKVNPTEPDVYHVRVKSKNKEIRNSPFIVELKYLSKGKLIPHGNFEGKTTPDSYEIDLSDIRGDLTARCCGDKGKEVPVEIIKTSSESKNCRLRIQPQEQDIYRISVKCDGKEIECSPFIVELRTHSQKEYIAHSRSSPPYFHELLIERTGSGELTTNCYEESGKQVPAYIEERSQTPPIYRVRINPEESGLYNICVKSDRRDIKNSPFKVDMRSSPKKEFIDIDPKGSNFEGVSNPDSYELLIKKSGEGKLTAVCSGDKGGYIPVEITEPSSTSEDSKLAITPLEPDIYHINVKENGKSISNSPFLVEMKYRQREKAAGEGRKVEYSTSPLVSPLCPTQSGGLPVSYDTAPIVSTDTALQAAPVPNSAKREGADDFSSNAVRDLNDRPVSHASQSSSKPFEDGDNLTGTDGIKNSRPRDTSSLSPTHDSTSPGEYGRTASKPVTGADSTAKPDTTSHNRQSTELDASPLMSSPSSQQESREMPNDAIQSGTGTGSAADPDMRPRSSDTVLKSEGSIPDSSKPENASKPAASENRPASSAGLLAEHEGTIHAAPVFSSAKRGESKHAAESPSSSKQCSDDGDTFTDTDGIEKVRPHDSLPFSSTHDSMSPGGYSQAGSKPVTGAANPNLEHHKELEPNSEANPNLEHHKELEPNAAASPNLQHHEPNSANLEHHKDLEPNSAANPNLEELEPNSAVNPNLEHHKELEPNSAASPNLQHHKPNSANLEHNKPNSAANPNLEHHKELEPNSAANPNLEHHKELEPNSAANSNLEHHKELEPNSAANPNLEHHKELEPNSAANPNLEHEPNSEAVDASSSEQEFYDCLFESSEDPSAYCYGEKDERVPVEIAEISPGSNKYRFKVSPTAPDVYHIRVNSKGKEIKNSPFIVELKYLSKGEFVPHSNFEGTVTQDSYEIYVGNSGGKLTAGCCGDKGKEIPVEIMKTNSDSKNCRLRIQPQEPDIYRISVKRDGKEVESSPFIVELRTRSQKEYIAHGRGSPPYSHEMLIERPGSGELTTKCYGESGKQVPAYVKEICSKPPIYRVRIDPEESGLYNMEVKSDGKDIKNSPFKVDMKGSPRKEFINHKPKGSNFEGISNPDSYELLIKKPGKGKLTASCIGDKGSNIPVEIDEPSSKKCKLSMTPSEPDSYHIDVKENGKSIKNSPFKVEMKYQPRKKDASDAQKVVYSTKPSSSPLASSPSSQLKSRKMPVGIDASQSGTGMDSAATPHIVPESEGSTPASIPSEGRHFSKPENASRPVSSENRSGSAVLKASLATAGPDSALQAAPGPDSAKRGGHSRADTDAADDPNGRPVSHADQSSSQPYKDDVTGTDGIKKSRPPGTSSLSPTHDSTSPGESSGPPATDAANPELGKLKPNEPHFTSSDAVDASSSGPEFYEALFESPEENLFAYCYGEKGERVPVEIAEISTGSNKYKFKVNPTEPDVYHIRVKSKGKEIKNSPFIVELKYLSKGEFIPQSKFEGTVTPDSYEINLGNSVGELTARCCGDKGKEIPVEIMKTSSESKNCRLRIQPQEPDIYRISVKRDGKEIEGSPFIVELRTHSQKEYIAHGRSSPPYSHELLTESAGSGELTTKCYGEGGKQVPAYVKEICSKPPIYRVRIDPEKSGLYNMEVKSDGKDIKNSPFKVDMRGFPKKEFINHKPKGSNFEGISNPDSYELHIKKPGKGKLTASCMGDKGSNIPVEIDEPSSKKCKLTMTPSEPDSYHIDVKENGKSIKNSPFKVEMKYQPREKDASDAQKVVYSTKPSSSPLASSPSSQLKSRKMPMGKNDASQPGTNIKAAANTHMVPASEGSPPASEGRHFSGPESASRPVSSENRSGSAVLRASLVTTGPDSALQAAPGPDSDKRGGHSRADTDAADDHNGRPVSHADQSFSKPHKDDVTGTDGIKKSRPPGTSSLSPTHDSTSPGESFQSSGPPATDAANPDLGKLKHNEPNLTSSDASSSEPEFYEALFESPEENLSTYCYGEKGERVPVEIAEISKGSNKYRLKVNPTEPDVYHIRVKSKGKEIENSPFIFELKYFSKGNFIPHNNFEGTVTPDSYEINLGNSGGELTARCCGDKEKEIPVEIMKTSSESKNCRLRIQPQEPDIYRISVKHDGKEIEGSPFIVELRTHSQKEYIAHGRSSPPYFHVLLIEGPGSGELTTKCYGEEGRQVPAYVKEMCSKPPIYRVRIDPEESGLYNMEVKSDGKDIKKSPFKVDMRGSPKKEFINHKPKGSNFEGISNPDSYELHINKPGKGKLTANCIGDKGSNIPVKIDEPSSKKCKLTMTPSEPDSYHIDVKENGKSIKNSPFKVEMKYQPREKDAREAQKVVYSTEPSSSPLVSSPSSQLKSRKMPVGIDASQSGTGMDSATTPHIVPESERSTPASIPSEVRHFSKPESASRPVSYENRSASAVLRASLVMTGPDSALQAAPGHDSAKRGGHNRADDLSSDTVDDPNGRPVSRADQSSSKPHKDDVTGTDGIKKSRPPDTSSLSPTHDSTSPGESFQSSGPPATDAANPDLGKLKPNEPHFTSSDAVDASSSGPEFYEALFESPEENLSTYCYGEKGERVPVEIAEISTGSNKYRLKVNPTEPDVYHIRVKSKGKEIKNSPFIVELKYLSKGEFVPHSNFEGTVTPDSYEINLSNSGGELTARCCGDKGKEIPVEIMKTSLESKNCRLRIQPQEPDIYRISVKRDRKEIEGSPFIVELRTHSQKEYIAHGRSSPPYFHELLIEGAGSGELTTKCYGEKGKQVPAYVKEVHSKPPIYRVRIDPEESGLYNMEVKSDGKDIKNSPFKVDMRGSPRKEFINHKPKGSNFEGISNPDSYELHIKKPGKGKLTASCIGDKGGNIPVEIDEPSSKKCKLTMTPSEPDAYHIDVKENGKSIKNSPFKVEMKYQPREKDASDAQKVVYSTKPSSSPLALSPSSQLKSRKMPVGKNDASQPGTGMDSAANKLPESEGSTPASIPSEGRHFSKPESASRPVSSENRSESAVLRTSLVTTGPDSALQAAPGHDSAKRGGHSRADTDAADDPNARPVSHSSSQPYKDDVTGTDGIKKSRPPGTSSLSPTHDSTSPGESFQSSGPPATDAANPDLGKLKPNEAHFTSSDAVDASSSGPEFYEALFDSPEENLSAYCYGEKGERVPVEIAEISKGSNKYRFKVNPTEPDVYHIRVKSKGEEIKNSPFIVELKYRSKGEFVSHSNFEGTVTPDSYEINLGNSGAELTARCCGDKGKEIPVEIMKTTSESKNCRLRIQPQEPDIYRISVKRDGKEIEGSPFIVELRTHSQKEYVAHGRSSPPYFHELLIERAGSGELTANCYGEGGKQVHAHIKEISERPPIYGVKINPEESGLYNICIKSDQKDIKHSPFKVDMRGSPRKEFINHKPKGSNFEGISNPDSYELHIKKPGKGKLTASCMGDKGSNIPVEIDEPSSKKCKLTMTPSEPDSYHIDVKENGKSIKNSPFKVEMKYLPREKDASDAQKVVYSTKPSSSPLASSPSSQLKSRKMPVGKNDASQPGTGMDSAANKLPESEGSTPASIPSEGRHFSKPESASRPVSSENRSESAVLRASLVTTGPDSALQAAPGHDSAKRGGHSRADTDAADDPNGRLVSHADQSSSQPYKDDVTGTDGIKKSRPPGTSSLSPTHDSTSPGESFQSSGPPATDAANPDLGKLKPNEPHFTSSDASSSGPEFYEALFESTEENLSTYCYGEKGERVPVEIAEVSTGSNKYRLKVNPTEPDVYHIRVKSKGKEIENSPFIVELKCLSKGEFVPHSKFEGTVTPDSYEINLSNSGCELTARCCGDKGKEIPVEIMKTSPESKKCRLRIQPQEPDNYRISVKCDKKEIEGSPFIVELRTHSQKEYVAHGRSSPPYFHDLLIERAGSGELTANCYGEGGKQVHAHIKEISERPPIYGVKINPEESGLYNICIKSDQKDIKHSPFKVDMRGSPRKEFINHKPKGSNFEGISNPDSYELHIKKPGKGKLTASCMGDKGSNIPVEIDEPSSKKCKLTMTPSEPDSYHIDVKENGKSIKNSPFKVEMKYLPREKDASDAQKVVYSTKPSSSPLASSPSSQLKSRKMPVGKNDASQPGTGMDSAANKLPESEGSTPASIPSEGRHFSKPESASRPVSSENRSESAVLRASLVTTGPDSALQAAPGHDSAKRGGHSRADTDAADDPNGRLVSHADQSSSQPHKDDVTGTDGIKKSRPPGTSSLSPTHDSTSPGESFQSSGPPATDAANPDLVKLKPNEPHFTSSDASSSGPEFYEALFESTEENLSTYCYGEKGERVPVEITEVSTGSNKYRLKVNPTEPDVYHIRVKSKGKEIENSPFIVELKYLSKGEFVPHSKFEGTVTPDSYEINLSNSGGELTARCCGDKGKEIPVEIMKTSPESKKCRLRIQPQEPDNYRISVKCDKKEIEGSPFIVELRTHSQKEYIAHGRSNPPYFHELLIESAGSGEPTTKCYGEKGKQVPAYVKEIHSKPPIYRVRIDPEESGLYNMEVKSDGTDIKNSPFKVDMRGSPRKEFINHKPKGSNFEGVSNPDSYELHIKKPGKEKLTASCIGDKGSNIPVEIDEPSSKICKLTMAPSEPDSYRIDVKENGRPITNSPFEVEMKYIQRVKNEDDAQKVVYSTKPHSFPLVSSLPISRELPESLDNDIQSGIGTGSAASPCISSHFPQSTVPDSILENAGTLMGGTTCQPAASAESSLNPDTLTHDFNNNSTHHTTNLSDSGTDALKAATSLPTNAAPSTTSFPDLAENNDVFYNNENTLQDDEDPKSRRDLYPSKPQTSHTKQAKKPSAKFPPRPSQLQVDSNASAADPVLHSKSQPVNAGVTPLKPRPSSASPVSPLPPLNAARSPTVHSATRTHPKKRQTSAYLLPDTFEPLKSRALTPDLRRTDSRLGVSGTPVLPAIYPKPQESSDSSWPPKTSSLSDLAGAPPIGARSVSPTFGSLCSSKTSLDPDMSNSGSHAATPRRVHGSGSKHNPFTDSFPSVSQVDLEGKTFTLGHAHKITIGYTQSQEEALHMSCSAPDAAEITASSDNKRQAHICTILPQKVGQYSISVMQNGKPTTGSPFNVNFIESQPLENITWSITSATAEISKVTARMKGAFDHKKLPVDITQIGDEKFSLDFVSPGESDYLLNITCVVKAGRKSLQQFKQGSNSAYLSSDSSIIPTEGLTAFSSSVEEGKDLQFSFLPSIPLSRDLVVTAHPQPITGTCQVSEDGFHHCSVKMGRPGEYRVEAKVGERQVQGTPFEVTVYPGLKLDKVKIYGTGISSAKVNSIASFTIDASEAGSGSLSADVTGCEPVFSVDISKNTDKEGIYTATYCPPVTGTYKIHVKLAEAEIPNSPFTVKIE